MDLIQAKELVKHDFDNYIILFHNNDIIDDINEFVNKHNFNDIITINEIFNFFIFTNKLFFNVS